VAVDSQGTLLAVRVRAANKADSPEAGAVMAEALEGHGGLESFTADKAYQRQAEAAARAQLGRDLHVTAKPATQKRASCRSLSAGFVERTFAWLGQCRLLAKDYEKSVASAEAWLWGAMMRLLVRRLAC
jgi:transposase